MLDLSITSAFNCFITRSSFSHTRLTLYSALTTEFFFPDCYFFYPLPFDDFIKIRRPCIMLAALQCRLRSLFFASLHLLTLKLIWRFYSLPSSPPPFSFYCSFKIYPCALGSILSLVFLLPLNSLAFLPLS